MRCPTCGTDRDRVVDSRAAEAGAAIRRRRECTACGQRFSTYERMEPVALTVRKRGGAAEPFRADKVADGMRKAAGSSPLGAEALRQAVARVEGRVRALGRREVDSTIVGTEVLAALADLDPVTALRFASVYKNFTTLEDFADELATLEKAAPPKRHGGA